MHPLISMVTIIDTYCIHLLSMLCLRSNQQIPIGYVGEIIIGKSIMDRMGFEPMASCLQSRRSSADLPAHQPGPAAIYFNLIYFLIDMCF